MQEQQSTKHWENRMKLVDLLVKELPHRGGWPKGAEIAVQDADSQICFSSHGDVYANKCQTDWYGGDWGDGDWSNPFIDTIADDRHNSIVTRNQYESALAASKAVVGHDGWIEWGGGECPVDSEVIVEVKFRDPNRCKFNSLIAGDFDWSHDGSNGDIIAYRLQQPVIDSRANDERLEQDLNECIGQDVDTPEWNGEGVPPVGVECEFKYVTGKWVSVEITAIARNGVCFVERGKNGENYVSFSREFRPLRTEAEKAMESAKHIIAELCRDSASNGHSADLIMEAIAEGKIPGVKLESK